jgi:hypothetical protein
VVVELPLLLQQQQLLLLALLLLRCEVNGRWGGWTQRGCGVSNLLRVWQSLVQAVRF